MSLTNTDEARIARRNGCRPFWWAPDYSWHCGCEDLLHACDQQCSIISLQSALKTRPGHLADPKKAIS